MEDVKPRYDVEALTQDLSVELSEVQALFSSYYSEMQASLEKITNYVKDGDFHTYQKIIHNIKGISANLNVDDIYQEAVTIENLLKRSKNSEAQARITYLDGLVHQSEIEMRKYFLGHGLIL